MERIIFDLDGVLVDSRPLHYYALNKALESVDLKYSISIEDHIARYDGRPTRTKLQMRTEDVGLPPSMYDLIWKRKQDYTLDAIMEQVHTNPRLQSILEALSKKGYKLTCASNAVRKTIVAILDRMGVLSWFDFIYSNEDIDHPKPHPAIYTKILADTETSPRHAMICEDSPVGRRAALASGCWLCPIASPEHLTLDYLCKSISYYEEAMKNCRQIVPWIMNSVNVLIPMAGEGSRFRASHDDDKPMIAVRNRPMIQVVCRNINILGTYIFLMQEKHDRRYNYKRWMSTVVPHGSDCIVQIVPRLTAGAACTALSAETHINTDEPLLIVNSDQFVEWDSNAFLYKMQSEGLDGGILIFECPEKDPKWSYAQIDSAGFVTRVAEKEPISTHATVGIYYWSKGSDFVRYTKQMIEKDIRVNNEYYVCPVYNEAIQDGKKIAIFKCDRMWGIGTPQDLEIFESRYEGPV
jgi:HAD superfamily hydrolase (TIGR01509 family)